MRSTFTRKQAALACAVALGVFSATANAQGRDINEKGLLLDTRGAAVMNATGLCWHSAYGPAPMWTSGCHANVPAPVAVVAAAAPPPAYEKVAFEADILFQSDKSALSPAGRDTLDAFVSRIGGLDTQSVMAIGYADRRGSEAANLILSEERVGAVKSYLVSKGVAADRVRTSAWGESRPSTAAGECRDADTHKNVACMQPDRHVFIEISGSRLAK